MRHVKRWQAIGVSVVLLVAGLVVVATGVASGADETNDCALRYVAGGDGVVYGTDVDRDASKSREELRYSRQLLEEHLKDEPNPGPWCEYNTSKDPTTSKQYVDAENPTQQAQAWEKRPRLITVQLGRQNSSIIDHVTKCFKNVKDHDFLEANVCALAVYANQPAFDSLEKELAGILNTHRLQQDGNPNLVVAVVGYFNPFPAATDVAVKVPQFCPPLVDTMATCLIRWVQLPPALITLDQIVKKLNESLKKVVDRFTEASQGRFLFVNPYEEFKSHCMKMEVQIKTQVYHPPSTTDTHDTPSSATFFNFGCSDTWIASDGNSSTKSPFLYLTPAATGVLIKATQETKSMGINPNEKGHDCIADMIWEAKVTPDKSVKHMLGSTEKPVDDVCSDVDGDE